MNLTRCAARIVTPLTQIMNTPARNISRVQYSLRLGIFDRFSSDKKTHPLDRFLGTWDENVSQESRTILQRLGLRKTQSEGMAWMKYTRSGDLWTCTTGFEGEPDTTEYNFKLFKEVNANMGGIPYKIYMAADGENLVETQKNCVNKDFVLDIVRKIDGNRMICTYTYQGDSMTVTFRKRTG